MGGRLSSASAQALGLVIALLLLPLLLLAALTWLIFPAIWRALDPITLRRKLRAARDPAPVNELRRRIHPVSRTASVYTPGLHPRPPQLCSSLPDSRRALPLEPLEAGPR